MKNDNSLFIALLLAASNPATGQDQSPPLPDAVLDLKSSQGVRAVDAQWRYTDVNIVQADHFGPGHDLKPTGPAVPTNNIEPRINTPAFENAAWTNLTPESLEVRRTNGLLAFGWYRLDITVPPTIGTFDTTGSTIVLETVIDDYAEVWVNGSLPQVLGQSGGHLPKGWNTPSRVVLTASAHPGDTFHVALFAANGPLSDPPPNYVWIRSATLDFYAPGRARTEATVPTTCTRVDAAFDQIVAPATQAVKLADGFAFTEGPLWVPQLAAGMSYGGGGRGGYLLFSDPNKNVIHRWDPVSGDVSVYRTKSGYSGVNGAAMRDYHQPGSNGLALSPEGKLTICEHGNRRVTRLEPNGTVTVLADRYDGRRLNSPNDLVYRSDGTLFFTDPPFGLPLVHADPRKELPFSGVFCLYNGTLTMVSQELKGPNGLALSPDEKMLYISNWDERHKVIVRYDVGPDGSLSHLVTLVDLTRTTPGEICFDGLKVDTEGNIFSAAPDGLRIFAPTGRHLGTVSLPELPANFAFGGADGTSLFVTARHGLYRLDLRSRGAGLH